VDTSSAGSAVLRSTISGRQSFNERNEPEGGLFILRCNTSWIVPDFVHAPLSAYDDRSSPQDTLAKNPLPIEAAQSPWRILI